MAWTNTIKILDLSDTQVKALRYIWGTVLGIIIGAIFALINYEIIMNISDITKQGMYLSIINSIGLAIETTIVIIFKLPKPVIPEKIETT